MWRDPNGDSRSKLLLTEPEMVIAIVVRGDTEPNGERKDEAAASGAGALVTQAGHASRRGVDFGCQREHNCA
jgi:hypothetical protein